MSKQRFITDDNGSFDKSTRRLSRLIKEGSLEHIFTYHPPREGQPERYALIRDQAKQLALLLEEQCPGSRERSLALTKLEEAVFWANAAIARHEADADPPPGG